MDTLRKKLLQDPRVKKAKELLSLALHEHQKNITFNLSKKKNSSYLKQLKTFAKIRSGELFYPYMGSGLGKGPLVELVDGSIKYDFISGIGVHILGHNHPCLIDPMIDSALSDLVMQGHLQQNQESLIFSKKLLKIANQNKANLKHCFLSTTGVMANENALKVIFHHQYPKARVLAFEKCFFGRTLSAASITDKPNFRDKLPQTIPVDYIPFYDPNHHDKSLRKAKKALLNHLSRYPNQHATMIMEMVQGEAGAVPGNKEFFISLIDILKKHGISILIDEVQTFGRTQTPFAFQLFGLDRLVDVVTVGKLTQVCATLFKASYKPKAKILAQTFTASTSALFAGNAILNEIIHGGHFGPKGKNEIFHQYFCRHLKRLEKKGLPIKGPFGIGGMVGFTAFDGDGPKSIQFAKRLFDKGLIGLSAGSHPVRIRFLLPIGALEKSHIDDAVNIIEKTFNTF